MVVHVIRVASSRSYSSYMSLGFRFVFSFWSSDFNEEISAHIRSLASTSGAVGSSTSDTGPCILRLDCTSCRGRTGAGSVASVALVDETSTTYEGAVAWSYEYP